MTNDKELLIRLKAGDKPAFAELVAIYQKKVINICYRFLLSKEDAEDVSQEVFIEVYHSISYFRGEAKIGTWLYRIAVTKSLDEIKRKNRKKRITSIGKTLGLDFLTEQVTDKQRPDKKMEEEEDYSNLLKLMNKLLSPFLFDQNMVAKHLYWLPYQ